MTHWYKQHGKIFHSPSAKSTRWEKHTHTRAGECWNKKLHLKWKKLTFLTGRSKHQRLPRFQSKLHLSSSLGFWARKELLLRELHLQWLQQELTLHWIIKQKGEEAQITREKVWFTNNEYKTSWRNANCFEYEQQIEMGATQLSCLDHDGAQSP